MLQKYYLATPTPMDRSQAKRWCFTLNNPKEDDSIDTALTTYMIVGDEVGESGTRHFQGYVEFIKQTRLTALKKLLPAAHWEKSKGSPYSNFKYCSKDGKFQEHGVRPKNTDEDKPYTKALNAETIEEGIKIIQTKRPRDYCLHGESIERNLKRAKVESTKALWPLESFIAPPLMLEKATLLCGPSGIGKTQYALSHFKKPLLVSHIDQLKTLSTDNDGVIFDDMSFKHWPIEAVIHLLDIECTRTINVRYGTVNIPANTVKIFTSNLSNPFYLEDANEEQKAAVERRLQRINVHRLKK